MRLNLCKVLTTEPVHTFYLYLFIINCTTLYILKYFLYRDSNLGVEKICLTPIGLWSYKTRGWWQTCTSYWLLQTTRSKSLIFDQDNPNNIFYFKMLNVSKIDSKCMCAFGNKKAMHDNCESWMNIFLYNLSEITQKKCICVKIKLHLQIRGTQEGVAKF